MVLRRKNSVMSQLLEIYTYCSMYKQYVKRNTKMGNILFDQVK